jgi:hypothetical protein
LGQLMPRRQTKAMPPERTNVKERRAEETQQTKKTQPAERDMFARIRKDGDMWRCCGRGEMRCVDEEDGGRLSKRANEMMGRDGGLTREAVFGGVGSVRCPEWIQGLRLMKKRPVFDEGAIAEGKELLKQKIRRRQQRRGRASRIGDGCVDGEMRLPLSMKFGMRVAEGVAVPGAVQAVAPVEAVVVGAWTVLSGYQRVVLRVVWQHGVEVRYLDCLLAPAGGPAAGVSGSNFDC